MCGTRAIACVSEGREEAARGTGAKSVWIIEELVKIIGHKECSSLDGGQRGGEGGSGDGGANGSGSEKKRDGRRRNGKQCYEERDRKEGGRVKGRKKRRRRETNV